MLALLLFAATLSAQEAAQAEPVTLDSYHPFHPPATLEQWSARRGRLRTQILLAAGLWPLPEGDPIEPTIHGMVDRGDYTVEKVYFASLPGHYVSGNLYRPTAPSPVRRAAVLSPHGHFEEGRFTVLDEDETEDRWPLQARCAQLARMGCVVFHYDMVGYADSTAITHREGFTDADAVQAGHTFLGLQLWNSIRALDFITSLPDVDPERVGVTGASGGGSQTFLLCAVDDRPAAAFPAVMVSTAMQGGCVCENAPYLRLGTGNVEFAALFAPKPLALSGADDWTIEIETKGLPELKALYQLYGAEDKVTARCWPEYGHNYNRAAREMMYAWFNEHLGLGLEQPVVEQPFETLTRAEMSVFDESHPRPQDEGDASAVRRWWSEQAVADEDTLRAAVDVILGVEVGTPPSASKGIVVVAVVGEPDDEDPGLDHLNAMAEVEVRRVALAEDRPPIDSSRHGTYVGYSWGYNPTAATHHARRIRRALLDARGSKAVRLVSLQPRYTPAAALALAGAGDPAGVDMAVLVEAALPDSLESVGVVPGIVRLGGIRGLLRGLNGVALITPPSAALPPSEVMGLGRMPR